MIVYAFRHGESEVMRWRMANPDALVVPAQYIPDDQVSISSFGTEQGAALKRFFQSLAEDLRPTVGFSSPFKRAIQTGTLALDGTAALPLIVDSRLREIDFGVFDGLTKKGRAARYQQLWQERKRLGKADFRPPEGENWHDVRARLREFTNEVLLRLPDSANVAISGHEVMMNIMSWEWEGMDAAVLATVAIPSAAVTTYKVENGRFLVMDKNRVPISASGEPLFSTESKIEAA